MSDLFVSVIRRCLQENDLSKLTVKVWLGMVCFDYVSANTLVSDGVTCAQEFSSASKFQISGHS